MIKLNGIILDFKTFPNGETLVDGEQLFFNTRRLDINTITLKYENDSDLIKLMFAKRHLDDSDVRCELDINYMPYSRMDRSEGSSVFTLKYLSQLINDLCFERVNIIEPHSDVTAALIDRAICHYPTVDYTNFTREPLLEIAIDRFYFDKEKDFLFFPDAGAQKRYGKVNGYRQLVGFKDRDFATGRINKLDVVGNVDGKGFKVIILDDLSSKGGTFILSAQKLRELGASEVYLVVTHCEESIYDGDIFKTDLINGVISTDSIINEAKHEKHIVIKL